MNGLRAMVACVLVGLVLGFGGVAQALPVSTGLLGWYEANDVDGNPATSNPGSGTAVSTWVNKANPGTNNGIAYGTPPAPTVQANAMNGQSVLRFGGNDYYGMGHLRTSAGPYTYFGVTASTSSGGVTYQRIVSTWDGSGYDWDGFNWATYRPCTRTWDNSGTARPYPSPWAGFVRTMSAASGKKIMNLRFGNNSQSGVEWFTGDMSEVLVYTQQLNTAAQLITQNYLMAKYYGTNTETAQPPDPNATTPTNDLYSGDDAARGHYDYDVCGVGRATDGTQLLRTNDPSITSPTAWHNFNAGIIIEAIGGLDNGEWLLAGHKVATNSWVATDLPPYTDQRWDRVWYLDYTGALDARLTFDFSEGGMAFVPPPPGKAYELLYSATNAFAFTKLSLTGTVAGDQVSFMIPAGTQGDGYYTLALGDPVPEPASLSLLAAGITAMALRRRRGTLRPAQAARV